MMNRVFITCLVLLGLSACAITREQFKDLENRVVVQDERISILEGQLMSMDFSNVHLINEHIQALNNRINNIEGRSLTPVAPYNDQNQSTHTSTLVPVDMIRGSIIDDEVNTLYNEGRRLYENRDFAGAIRILNQVSRQSPNHELSANAHYWIGESYYAMADFSAARLSFQRVQDQYPNSTKFIDSQLKIAMTWIRQDRKDNARTILLAIKRDFPNYERMSIVDQNLRLTQ